MGSIISWQKRSVMDGKVSIVEMEIHLKILIWILYFPYVNYVVWDSYSFEEEYGLIHYDNNIKAEKST